ncbi:arginine/lysine/ornithine decarboxylase [Thermolongibacillus altinsuensis]|jgi:arginine/lysine/ornithine decarboxylase|uniref:Arginine/lysine/ornithine decarboxylase n=1 Tax=Thermolongibacillus altinsuensis TaxID=575256 RepID=A0A4R1QCY2_9BACL|nr:aminotransferase class I/II-fold pyridoxal phosphate-dependent enzyme [Thermolongibacillus altinsuensis]TCL46069.1 arginine/lysine/ornithine decarboxylase [Thermolongibacillus altinsuensis]GMB10090.1 arginine decarboxylase [Thermolongibacillus altinsuensis]
MDEQKQTPLYSALYEHHQQQPISFHVPGHKYGSVFPKEARSFFVPLLHLDVTELSHLDDLHHPTAAIAEAQRLASQLYGVKQTYFLVNGSTVGNLAMIATVCQENKKIIVQRNCHKSIINALNLMEAEPIFISPEFDEEVQTMGSVSFETIENTLRQHPDAAAIVLTNPNYYGMSIDLTEVVQLAHSYHIPVLVDEAHGAHFILGKPFPKTAIACGADLVVHSAHKTLPAMTMGSFLHFNSRFINEKELKYFLQLFQTSSPSYPIMASLDLARYYLSQLSQSYIQQLESQIHYFKQQLKQIDGIDVVESKNPLVQTDLLKITLQTRSHLSGYELQRKLEREGVFTELADPNNVLLVYPLALVENIDVIIEKIKKALQGISCEKRDEKRTFQYTFPTSSEVVSYKKIKHRKRKVVPLEEAVHCISAQMVIPYPPGIPVLFVGEIITEQHIQLIQYLKDCGAYFQSDTINDGLEVFE